MGLFSQPPAEICDGGWIKSPARKDLCWRVAKDARQHRSFLAALLNGPPEQFYLATNQHINKIFLAFYLLVTHRTQLIKQIKHKYSLVLTHQTQLCNSFTI